MEALKELEGVKEIETKVKFIKSTRNNHSCVMCGNKIPAGSKCMARVSIYYLEEYDETNKAIAYFCSQDCYDDMELSEYQEV